MEIKLKINTDKILAETGITIDEPEQWLALMDRGIEAVKEGKEKNNRRVRDLISLFDNVMMLQSIRTKLFKNLFKMPIDF